MSAQHRLGSLGASLVSLALGVLGIVLLCSILRPGTVASAAQDEGMLDSSAHQLVDSTTDADGATVSVTKTVEPLNLDTGAIASICFTVSGLSPRSLDVVLAQDVSESMLDTVTTGVTRLQASQAAANAFVGLLPITDRIAIVPFSTTAYLIQPLTTTHSTITRTISGLTATGDGTNMGKAISVSHEELITSTRHETGTVKTIILLSDGIANCTEDGYCFDDPTTLKEAAGYVTRQATLAASDTIKIYTIGFGAEAANSLLQTTADIGHGKYFSAPDAETLETIYQAIALELHNLIVTDILTPGVETDCSQWPAGRCVRGPGGVTTVTLPISGSAASGPERRCFTIMANLDPPYTGPINLPGSNFCYQSPSGQTICEGFNNPAITVGGRMITGYVFYDLDADGHQGAGEAGAINIPVRTSTGMITRTDIDGNYVLRTSSQPTISVIVEVPAGYVTTTPTSTVIPAATGIYSAQFGIRTVRYFPVVMKRYPPIINGGFEDGWTGWTHGGELAQTITSTEPYEGRFSALLGDPAYVCQNGVPTGSAWMEQAIYVPSTDHPRLHFEYRIVTQDMNPYVEDGFDSFDVRINGNLEFRDANRTYPYGCAPQEKKDLGWRSGEIDLRPYRGQQVRIRFLNRNSPDKWYNTWTFVDDVQCVPQ